MVQTIFLAIALMTASRLCHLDVMPARVVRIDPFRFLAGYRTRRLNQLLSGLAVFF